jgi:hypothetical protein
LAVKVRRVPVPESVNGVDPERVSVPFCVPVANMSVAEAPDPLPESLAFNTTEPPTLTEPEPRLNTTLFSELPAS